LLKKACAVLAQLAPCVCCLDLVAHQRPTVVCLQAARVLDQHSDPDERGQDGEIRVIRAVHPDVVGSWEGPRIVGRDVDLIRPHARALPRVVLLRRVDVSVAHENVWISADVLNEQLERDVLVRHRDLKVFEAELLDVPGYLFARLQQRRG
jgi:hypothetical protein